MNKLTPNQKSALDTKGNLALTANAGSGKTFVLARRYLNALTEDKLDISGIAAITFTDKAASELYNRISRLIDESIEACTDKKEQERLGRIRRQLVSANISTIHSFCINILRDYPVESNLDAGFIPIDEKLSQELIELSVEESIKNCFDDPSANDEIKDLIRVLGSKSRLLKQIVKLIENRKNVQILQNKIYLQDKSGIKDYFNKTFQEYFSRIWNGVREIFLDYLQQINSAVLISDPGNKSADELIPLLSVLKKSKSSNEIIFSLDKIRLLVFTIGLTIKKQGYLSKVKKEIFLADKVREVEDIFSDIHKFNVPEENSDNEIKLADFGIKLLKVFDNSLLTYERKKKAEGYIDYEDILLYVKQLLQKSEVQKNLAEKYKLIMVDEFQDTNEIQYQIFLPLLDYLKKGNLFIVGDEKQSIYKFRDAEIEIFNLTRNDIKNAGSKNNLLVLPDSFRMSPEICVFCNHIFRKIFKDPVELFGEVPAADLICARREKVDGKVSFLIKIEDPESEVTEEQMIIRKIKQIKNQSGYNYSHFTILVRKRKHFENFEKELNKNKIPYSIVGGRGFYQRQSISDIFNYLSFLSDKNNNTALAGVLRSPFFNISDSDLYKISLQNGRSFWEKLNKFSQENDSSTIVDTLNENLALCNSLNISRLIEKLITDNNYLATVSSRIDGNQEAANVFKLINIARNFNATGFRNLYDFINYLKDAISESVDEAQASGIVDTDAVKLMTIHQAKGLEFPIVFLCKTEEISQKSIAKTGEVIVDKEFGLLTKLPKNDEYFDDYFSAPIVDLYNFMTAKKDHAELKRLLYVAVTRAQDQLYISGTIKEDKVLNKNSFLSLLALGLNSDFSSDKINISEDLSYLKFDGDRYFSETDKLNLEINFQKEIEDIEIHADDNEKEISGLKIYTEGPYSHEKLEIISASKVSIYNQCPLKYYLTYESGFSKLNSLQHTHINLSSLENEYDADSLDDSDDFNIENLVEQDKNISTNIDASLYGKMFHLCMEKNLRVDEIDKYLNIDKSIKDFERYSDLLKTDLKKIQESNFAKNYLSLPSYKNEFEIYIQEKDYFLHGITDRIIFDKNKIIICDYKTDNIELKEIKKHSEYYLMQLKFYLYISSRLFSDFEIFEGNLIFIKHPDDMFSIRYTKKELESLEKEITEIILNIRNKKFDKNLHHCRLCSFSDSANRCIIN
ncbi:MAG: UvrD-helicase domain-containing protein [Ignavibacteriaceae bacterium]|jgi:ATP-dependent helicase/nuclease subunit A|nr:UvrD-helicase domain-containing protein [Ignavibacteriaceae bacterium]